MILMGTILTMRIEPQSSCPRVTANGELAGQTNVIVDNLGVTVDNLGMGLKKMPILEMPVLEDANR
jgi:hypothetical protein